MTGKVGYRGSGGTTSERNLREFLSTEPPFGFLLPRLPFLILVRCNNRSLRKAANRNDLWDFMVKDVNVAGDLDILIDAEVFRNFPSLKSRFRYHCAFYETASLRERLVGKGNFER